MRDVQQPKLSSRRRGGPIGCRRLVFERLDVRAVLSTNPLQAGLAWDLQLDAPAPLGGSQSDLLAGGFGQFGPGPAPSPRQIAVGSHGMGMMSGFYSLDNNGGDRGQHASPSLVIVPATALNDGLWFGGGSSVLVVTVGGWNGPGPHNALSTLRWFDFPGLPVAPMQSSAPAAPPLAPRDTPVAPLAMAGGLGGRLAAGIQAGGSVAEQPTQSPAAVPTASDAASVGRVESIVAVATSPAARANLFVVPSGSSSSASEPRRDESAPAPDNTPSDRSSESRQGVQEGGLIELDTSRSAAQEYSPSHKLDKGPGIPKRARRLADSSDRDAFWDELLEMLWPAKENATDKAADEEAGTTANRPPAADVAATFDEGGAIELAAGAKNVAIQSDAAAATDAVIAMDPLEITVDAGVALFQAFELGAAPDEGPPAPAVEPRAAERAPDDPPEGSAGDAEETPRRVAAGVGLGLLAVLPISLVRKRKNAQLPRHRGVEDVDC